MMIPEIVGTLDNRNFEVHSKFEDERYFRLRVGYSMLNNSVP